MNLSRILCTFSGDDYSIIKQCNDKKIQYRFMAIGVFVTAIFALCFISCYFTFSKLIKNNLIGIPIGLFFSYMITNIYLLLLYTLSKNTFPCKTDKAAQLFSVSLRIIFICFIAIVVSKPLETIAFSDKLKVEIEQYKKEQIIKYTQSTTAYFNEETKNLKLIIEKQRADYSDSYTSKIDNYSMLQEKKENQKNELIFAMINLVNNSNYFLQSIVILNTKYSYCWLLTFFIMFIFLCPAYLKNYLGEQSFYYEAKRVIENRIVKEEYTIFKTKYKLLLLQNFDAVKEFSESYIDAPFNTIRKRDEREFLKEDDLISDLYNV